MEREAVKSTTMRSIGYEASTRVLAIEFQSGEVYEYLDVPIEMYKTLSEAESKGKYFNREIRDNYRHERKGKAKGASGSED